MAKKRLTINISISLEGDDGNGPYLSPSTAEVSYQACDASDPSMLSRPSQITIAVAGTDMIDDIVTDALTAINTDLGIV